ncbi:MAG: type II toxin-antitoxin system PemK/MazF family toxin [Candidatus Binatia bacterium]
MKRGEVWWASLQLPTGSEPGYRRPVVIIQSDDFTASRIDTIIAAAVTSNTRLAFAPGNVVLRRREAGLPRDSVINVSQLLMLDKAVLTERIGRLSPRRLQELDIGVRLVLAL